MSIVYSAHHCKHRTPHVDQVTVVLHNSTQAARQATTSLHGAQARVTNLPHTHDQGHHSGKRKTQAHASTTTQLPHLDGNNLSTGCHAVQRGVVLVVGGADARHVAAVGARVSDNAERGALVVDVQGVVQERLLAQRAPLPLGPKVGKGRGTGKVARLGGIDGGPPHRAIMEHHAVIHWTCNTKGGEWHGGTRGRWGPIPSSLYAL